MGQLTHVVVIAEDEDGWGVYATDLVSSELWPVVQYAKEVGYFPTQEEAEAVGKDAAEGMYTFYLGEWYDRLDYSQDGIEEQTRESAGASC